VKPPAGEEHLARLYFGTDFCQTLLPTPRALRAALEARGGSEAGFTLVTPPVNDDGLARIAALLDVLVHDPARTRAEVVVNDWGALRLVARAGGRPRPVLGRLMTRFLRDPRLAPPAPSQGETAADTAPASSAYGRLLASMGVEHVEVDSGRPGIPVDFARLGLRPSVHVGWASVSRGRVCLYAGLAQPDLAKFTSSTRCRRECRTYEAAVADADANASTRAPLVAAGNAIFERHDEALVEQALACASRHGGRVVLRERAFSETAWALADLPRARRWLDTELPS
jgi:hypothetical protein